jgi:hypothetical protein
LALFGFSSLLSFLLSFLLPADLFLLSVPFADDGEPEGDAKGDEEADKGSPVLSLQGE